jgi:23S rRNA pseudouridine1911/1915/1917 synthase
VLVNGNPVNQNYRIKSNDSISVTEIADKGEGLIPENIPVTVLYKDEALIVVDKPAGMVVYPAAGHSQGTLMNAVAFHCKKLASTGGPLRPGVVHRLDKDTSGVMVVALDDKAYYHLAEQFKQRTINRKYIALVYGNFIQDEGEIALKIGRSATDRKKMSTRVKTGREAVTTWKVLKRYHNATLIQAKLGTGRTHQIRVHFASIGHPVLGDRTYGKKTEVEKKGSGTIRFPRQMLHAEVLGFVHPQKGEYLEFSSPLPEDMAESIAALEAAL